MKIAIEARSLAAQGGGVKTYTENLLRALPAVLGADTAVAITTKPGLLSQPSAIQEVAVLLRHELLVPWWLSGPVQKEMKHMAPDVVHYTKAAVPSTISYPTVVTIHDVIPILFPSSQALPQRLYWPRTLRLAATKAHHIIAVSQATKRDIISMFGVEPERITVTPEAVDTARFRADISADEIERVRQAHKLPASYILTVATQDMRKNTKALLEAFAQIAGSVDVSLAIAGGSALKNNQIKSIYNQLPVAVQQRITWLGFVPDTDLPALYAGAKLFVWPSVYEGWGLPPLEAMACGVPTIVSDGGALPEVVGTAGEIVAFSIDSLPERLNDTDFVKRLGERMVMVLSDTNRHVAMRAAGLTQVQSFSWHTLAQQTYEVYTKVAAMSL